MPVVGIAVGVFEGFDVGTTLGRAEGRRVGVLVGPGKKGKIITYNIRTVVYLKSEC